MFLGYNKLRIMLYKNLSPLRPDSRRGYEAPAPQIFVQHNSSPADREQYFYVICDSIRSSENVGSIFRTSDALGIDKIFLCGISPTPTLKTGGPDNEKLAKTALGAEKTVAWEYHNQTWRLLQALKKQGVFITALEQTSKSISLEKLSPQFPLALIIGHEIKGVSPSALKLADTIIEIPMHGTKESLNVSVAFGIAGYEINKHRLLR